MIGRARRRAIEAVRPATPEGPPVCPICDRPIPPAQRDAHHWVPRSQGGRETRLLHKICHRQIHALFTERELARDYHSPDALRAHPQMRRFIEWVRRKPDHFTGRVARSGRIR